MSIFLCESASPGFELVKSLPFIGEHTIAAKDIAASKLFGGFREII